MEHRKRRKKREERKRRGEATTSTFVWTTRKEGDKVQRNRRGTSKGKDLPSKESNIQKKREKAVEDDEVVGGRVSLDPLQL